MQQTQIPPLAEGEIYGGHYSNAAGETIHFALLPGDSDDSSWQEQMEWAKSIGGDLPNRVEQALLWANHRDKFQKDWYWSNESHHENDAYAWVQTFYNGSQISLHKVISHRARAVRRFLI